MTKDFRDAEEYARKAILMDDLFNENKYANYITSLLCQNKYIDYSGINVPLVAVCNVPPVAQCNVPPQKWLQ